MMSRHFETEFVDVGTRPLKLMCKKHLSYGAASTHSLLLQVEVYSPSSTDFQKKVLRTFGLKHHLVYIDVCFECKTTPALKSETTHTTQKK